MNADEVIRDLPRALLNWYDFGMDSKVLFVSGGKPECEVLFNMLKEKGIDTARVSENDLEGIRDVFDYIVAAGIIERSGTPVKLLAKLKTLLKPSGRLLIGAENRLAVRYFCGDKDEFTGHVLDGIDGYVKVNSQRKKVLGGRLYSKAEYEKILEQAGFGRHKFYSVMPGLERPQMIIAEGYMPNESADVRIFPQYKSPGSVFLEEERLYEALMENHMFHPMANGYLMECSINGEVSCIDQVTVQGDRSRKEALATVIRRHDRVSKKALYPEGRKKIHAMLRNTEYLKEHGVFMAEAYEKDGAFVMPYIEGRIATEYFREVLRRSKETFIKELERFRQIIVNSSEHVPFEQVNWRQFEPWWQKRKKDDPNADQWEKRAFGSQEEKRNIGIILRRGYIDMVSINCFYTEDGFVFFDQEFYIENFPANAIFIRTVDFIYRDTPDLETICPMEEVLKQFGLYEYQNTWRAKGNEFLEKLRNDKELSAYHGLHRRDWRTVAINRHRMDYSQEEYERLFTNIFKGIENKKLYLFGSGRYAEQFIEQFGSYYEIAGIADNNSGRWGDKLSGVEIIPPDILSEIDEPFKVFICIKFFEDVLSQLKAMKIRDISVYDPRLDYDRPLKCDCLSETERQKQRESKPKKYHVGYVAGVFDLFHIGHLNLLKRAKEQCDYLIAGVVSDEQVMKGKKTRPYIPFEERLQIVQSCRYVDEAAGIPKDRADTRDAYYRYHFDVQFSGSDYADDPDWAAKKIFLQQHGSDLVFFPYTQTTSSTEIKEQINDREAQMKEFDEAVEEIKTQRDLERFRDIWEKEGKSLAIFGAGDCGHHVYHLLHGFGIRVECFIDNRDGGRTDEITGLKVLGPGELTKDAGKWKILICVVERKISVSIYEQLTELGIDEGQILVMGEYFYRLPIEYLKSNMEKYKKVYEMLEDDLSRRVYLAKMKKAFLMSNMTQVVSPSEEEYFDEKVVLTDDEVFIDCGGFDGDSSLKFLKKCRGRYRSIVIFEPERCKKAAIEKNLEGERYELYQAGVWSRRTRLNFDAMETDASRVSEKESGYIVDAVALDEVVYEKKPTFIKMDIEGSEQEALKGCRRILKEYKPKLAVCIYHKPDDLFEIPIFIKEINPEYRLYVRQYADSRTETVLYAL